MCYLLIQRCFNLRQLIGRQAKLEGVLEIVGGIRNREPFDSPQDGSGIRMETNKDVKNLTIVHLYPIELNIYGDRGNVLALRRRLEWRGFEAEIVNIGIGDE